MAAPRAQLRQAHDGASGERRVLGFGDQARQERGLDGYPVYTRKVTTDVSYLACAGRLFRHADVIYPQFATHNAHSIASVLELAPPGADYEFQRLHGMGRLLYAEAARQIAEFPRVRVYAPVGEHKDSAGVSGAAAARERRQYLFREPLHG